jgi:hypothetical protein
LHGCEQEPENVKHGASIADLPWRKGFAAPQAVATVGRRQVGGPTGQLRQLTGRTTSISDRLGELLS